MNAMSAVSNDQTATNSKGASMIRLDWQTALWIALFIFVIFTRFHHLGDKPFHHDEGLYAKYIWNFHVGMGYKYDPMQHGPFMFHTQQLALFLFGITNYTIRILPASMGLFLVLSLYLMRKRFDSGVTLLAGWLYAINPVFMYFQRFLRHDPLFSFFSILILLALVLWIKDRKPWQAYLCAISICVLYCIKENAFVNLLILATFAVLKVVVDFFENLVNVMMGKKDVKWVGLRSIPNNLNNYPMLSKAFLFLTLWGITFIIYAVGNQVLKGSFANWDKTVKIYWYLAFAVYALFVGFLLFMGEYLRWNKEKPSFLGLKRGFYFDSHVFTLCVLIFTTGFILLYTTFLTNRSGFWGGIYEWYTYWLHQHSIARIRGPFHYYHHQLLIYAFIPLTVVMIGLINRAIRKAGYIAAPMFVILWIIGLLAARVFQKPWPLTNSDLFTNEHLVFALGFLVAGTFCTVTYLRERLYLKAFLTWWSLLAYLMYSYLQEKVPWLTMHIVTPLIFLAAIYLVEIFRNKELLWRRNAMIAAFTVMALYSSHTAIRLCWHHEADPTEQMVYVQTTYEIPMLLKELDEMAFWYTQDSQKEREIPRTLGQYEERDLPIVIDGHATWPLYWYLRDWENVTYGKNVNPDKHIVVICNFEDRHTIYKKLDERFIARKYGLRAWYLPKRSDLVEDNFKKTFRNAWRWLLLRERFKPTLYGTQDICVFVREDMAKFLHGIDLGDEPAKPEPRRVTPKEEKEIEFKISQKFGRFGTADGLFNYPKDIAIDSSGNIFVADSVNGRVQKFDKNGKFLTAWGKHGEAAGDFGKIGQVYGPIGLGLDKQDNVYVADTWNHRIQKFDNNGKFMFTFGDSSVFWAPKDVVVDAEGNIYVVNTGMHKIQKFNRNGQQIWAVGSKGNGSVQFDEPVGIAMDSLGRLFVADTINQRISIYDKDGHLLKQFSVFGWEDQYSEPYIGLDQENNRVFATDSRHNRIQIFDMQGEFIGFWEPSDSSDAFKQPIGITVSEDNIYVVDSLNHRVEIFDKTSI
ncbi:TIGR03663 family protein [bacterium]|nr:TIGR03663 family protein [candidate division CSSED10-310 bacterium]